MNFKKIIFPLIVGMFFSAEKNANAQIDTLKYTGSLQSFVVPCGVTQVTISCAGGQGGSVNVYTGGSGALMVGTFTVVPAQTLTVLVGGQGVSTPNGGSAGGGGGGSFVMNGATPMIIAGGGGGRRDYGPTGMVPAGLGTTSTTAQNSEDNSGIGGTAGNGGTSGEPFGGGTGGPGGGLTTDGGPDGSAAGGPGLAYVNLGTPGPGCTSGSDVGGAGGYGGGGGGTFCYRGTPGGGGGYSGGGTGVNDYSAGGGGSYNAGSVQTNTTGGADTGNGQVIITWTVPTSPAITASVVSNVSCNGGKDGSAMGTASGGSTPYTYSWSDANTQTVATATGLTAGTYTITVTDACGGTATASVTLTQPPALTVTTGFTENVLCNGGSDGKTLATAAGGTGTYTYSWAPGGQTNTAAYGLTAGTYTVTVTDAKGCTATASSVITQPTALTLTGFATDTAICKGNCTDVNATAGGGTPSYSYAWNTGATTSSVNVCPIAKTTYTVTLTDANGCSNTATVTVDVNPCLGVNEVALLDEQVKFYPNPFSQSVNVDISVSGPVTVTIFNMMGQNVGAYTMDKGLNTINTSNMAAGIYLMQVKTQSGILNKKLVKVD